MQSLPGKKQDDKGQIYAQTRLLKDIKNLLCKMIEDNPGPQEEALVPVLFCDDDCNITGATAFIRDEVTTDVITQYFDANLAPTSTPPSGSPCGSNCPLDYELITECYEDIDTCEKYTQIISFVYKGGVKEQTEICWVLPDGSVSTVLPTNIRKCTEDCNCNPQDESFLGDNATLDTFNEIGLFIPKCCEITVTSSAGSFVIPAQQTTLFYSKKYDCLISDFSIAGDCVDDVHVILTRTK